MEHFLYLPPGGKALTKHGPRGEPPALPAGHTRLVCISDTHNEHRHLRVPWGHVLLHAGDVLTESGRRHTSDGGPQAGAKPAGVALLKSFVEWFGAQPHPHKVFIGGNHDGVLEALGPESVRAIVASHIPTPGAVAYLQHENAQVGDLRVFGSPYAHWGGHNNAFFAREDEVDYGAVGADTHVFLTHMPAMLPARRHERSPETAVMNAIHNCRALLHVGGHCHWAHGLMHSSCGVPCVVASVCEAHWRMGDDLHNRGARGDSVDLRRGGYNVFFPIIVVDMPVPPPPADAAWRVGLETTAALACAPDDVRCSVPLGVTSPRKPALLFFGPDTDAAAVQRLVPVLEGHFAVHHFARAEEAVAFIDAGSEGIAACIAKLGSRHNHCNPVLTALRSSVGGRRAFLVLHSSTACSSAATMESLRGKYAVGAFTSQSGEGSLVQVLLRGVEASH